MNKLTEKLDDRAPLAIGLIIKHQATLEILNFRILKSKDSLTFCSS